MNEKQVALAVGRIVKLDAEKIDFLLQGYGKLAFYAQEKNDTQLGKLIETLLNQYTENFQHKTEMQVQELKGIRKAYEKMDN